MAVGNAQTPKDDPEGQIDDREEVRPAKLNAFTCATWNLKPVTEYEGAKTPFPMGEQSGQLMQETKSNLAHHLGRHC